jgi:hypothetical protein
VRVNARQRLAGGIHLRLADGGVAVQRLALQVGERDGVEIEQGELPDAGRRQILRGGAASPPRPTTSTRAALAAPDRQNQNRAE